MARAGETNNIAVSVFRPITVRIKIVQAYYPNNRQDNYKANQPDKD